MAEIIWDAPFESIFLSFACACCRYGHELGRWMPSMLRLVSSLSHLQQNRNNSLVNKLVRHESALGTHLIWLHWSKDMERHSSDDTEHDIQTRAAPSTPQNSGWFHECVAWNHLIDVALLRIPYHRIQSLCADIIQRMHFCASKRRKYRHSTEMLKISVKTYFWWPTA